MGLFEITHFWILTLIFVTLVVTLLSIVSFKNIYKRFGLLKTSRRNFYECGFKAIHQRTVTISIQFFFLIIFFIIYDIELIFSFPFISAVLNHGFFDVLIFMFLYLTFLLTLLFDFDRFLTNWSI